MRYFSIHYDSSRDMSQAFSPIQYKKRFLFHMEIIEKNAPTSKQNPSIIINTEEPKNRQKKGGRYYNIPLYLESIAERVHHTSSKGP